MDIKQKSVGDVEVLFISGEIDLYNAPEIKKIMHMLIGEGKLKVAVDFNEVTYIDSSGIGAMISSMSNLKKNGGALVIMNLHHSVRKVFELTKLTSFFKIFDSEEEAIRSFNVERNLEGRQNV